MSTSARRCEPSHRVLVAFGTRPEAIKMAPVIHALRTQPSIDLAVAVTAQHRDMLDQVLDLFAIKPQFDLNIMEEGQSLTQVTCRVLQGIGALLDQDVYDAVLVHGDTTTTFASALAAFYHRVPVGHVEAGMRTGNIHLPFPEEANRALVDRFATWNFASSAECEENLLREGIDRRTIRRVPGNTVIDALLSVTDMPYEFPQGPIRDALEAEGPLVIVTAHRRESWGAPMEGIFRSVKRLSEMHPSARFLVATHSNPIVARPAAEILHDTPGVRIIGPQEYLPFIALIKRADLILSDSGGIQEEGPALGCPVVVLRDGTEYGELLARGAIVLAGTDEERIVRVTAALLSDPEARARMAEAGRRAVVRGSSLEIARVLAGELAPPDVNARIDA